MEQLKESEIQNPQTLPSSSLLSTSPTSQSQSSLPNENLQKYTDALKKEQQAQYQNILSMFKSRTHHYFLQAHTAPQLPSAYVSHHQILLTFIYFGVSGLDVLGVELEEKDKKEIIDWIYSLQVQRKQRQNIPENEQSDPIQDKSTQETPVQITPAQVTPAQDSSTQETCLELSQESRSSKMTTSQGKPSQDITPGGFRGSELMPLAVGNLAITYTALCTLRILGDDYSRIDKEGIFAMLADAYCEDGSFQDVGCSFWKSETDVRFVYSACAICALLQDWNVPKVDWNQVVSYLLQCRSYDGGFGHTPQAESHGGSSYCVVSSLYLLERLDTIENRKDLEQWLLKRQKTGFQGRISKPADSCYSFWIGGTLRNLGINHFVDSYMCSLFIMECENKNRGGFGKDPSSNPDILHTYMSICGLSILGHPELREIYPALGITRRATAGLKLPAISENKSKILNM